MAAAAASLGAFATLASTGNFTIAAKFLPIIGMLFHDKIDSSGNVVDRIEKYYALPPIAECGLTTYGSLVDSLAS